MNNLRTIDSWLIDYFFQRIIDYSNFKIGTTKFICCQFLILLIFFCNCKDYYNTQFIAFIIFSTWLLLETVNNIIDSFLEKNYLNKIWKDDHFAIRCCIVMMFAFGVLEGFITSDIFKDVFCLAGIIFTYVKYCSTDPKYRFRKKEKKVKTSRLAFAT